MLLHDVCVFVCLSVQNDFDNRLTYMVLLYNVASRRSLGRFIAKEGKGGGGDTVTLSEKSPQEKSIYYYLSFKTEIEKGKGVVYCCLYGRSR